MSICSDCNIEEKIELCCGSHPETGESVSLEMDSGEVVMACPNLDPSGACKIYHERPDPCRSYECYKFYQVDLVELMRTGFTH